MAVLKFHDLVLSLLQEYFQDGPTIDVLYFCESSMRFFKHKSELLRFQKKGVDRYPPGESLPTHSTSAQDSQAPFCSHAIGSTRVVV